MRKILEYIILGLLRILLSFRYRIRVEGLNKLKSDALRQKGGIIFLPNHPSYYIDPIIVCLVLWPKFPVRPMVVEYMYYAPFIHGMLKFIKALPIPNLVVSSNSFKRKKSEKVIQTVINGLQDDENFLIYPAGRVKNTAYESIGGASAVHRILEDVPQANIVLVRTKGIWGSRFSKAISSAPPALSGMIWDGIKLLFKNLIFFTPRREVTIELQPALDDFPRKASRLDLNRYLERFYNRPDGLTPQTGDYPGDSLALVSYSMWGDQFLPVRDLNERPDQEIHLDAIPKELQQKVIRKLADLSEMDPSTIKPEMTLASDLGLDSLDIAELVVYLQDQYDLPGVPSTELTTVAKLMAIVSKQIVCEEVVEDEKSDMTKWQRPLPKKRIEIAPGNTIAEVFLNQCQQMGKEAACSDARMGIQTYSDLKLRAILLADYLCTLPGTYIGILLPASVAANLLIMACQLAGKVPLMVNWTVGPRHLESVAKLSSVKVVISSWAFLDRLENADLSGIEESLLMLEDIVRQMTIFDKIKAFLRSKQSTYTIMKSFGIDKVGKSAVAVLLFTSGTESLPKGVPLSQGNILSNLRASLSALDIYNDDVIFAFLPPFHSFGFTITGILSLLSGMRVAYAPDPTDGPRLAHGFANWQSTILCGAPTFIKGMLKAATPSQIQTLRLCVSGAEKAPPELFEMLSQMDKPKCIAEGYGITECSPVLTLNPAGSMHPGVGKALPGIRLRIVHPETELPLSIGQRGLILANGPNIFSGYLNPGLSSPFIIIDGERWYKTGDLGYLDDEGYLTISGRMKRFIKMGGEMVSLASLEDAILQMASKKGWLSNHEGPSLAVCAKELPGEKPKISLFSLFDVSVDDINQSLKESGFSNLVKVSTVTRLSEIPIMGTGKVNYRALEGQG